MTTRTLDAESADWLAALRGEPAERAGAVERLHALLLRAARHEIARRRNSLPRLGGDLVDDLAQQAADDALVAVLDKLDTFRGDSRFTTWAYKFALLEAGVRARRRAWQDREVVLDPERWPLFAAATPAPDEDAERAELWATVHRLIAEDLTPHQRCVLIALAIDGTPIDVLAERLGTTRGALYKTLHDARRRLRAGLTAAGLTLGEG
jgi:RNA polymerase sigma-70 factor (ECF subfamily)